MSEALFILSGGETDDGHIDAETIMRLEAAKKYTHSVSCIILAGYEEHNLEMKQWLLNNTDVKVPIYLILAHDTIGQAVFTWPLIHALGIHKLILVTSDYHLPRAKAIFERIHSHCCKLSFIGCQHALKDVEAAIKHERESLHLFQKNFAHAVTFFDYASILLQHHPKYADVAKYRKD